MLQRTYLQVSSATLSRGIREDWWDLKGSPASRAISQGILLNALPIESTERFLLLLVRVAS